MVRDIVLKLKDKRLAAFSVFIPMLQSDSRAPAEAAASRLRKAGIPAFWDGDRALGKAYARSVKLPARNTIAWDVYFVYGPDAEWRHAPPRPAFWMHQLANDSKFLDPLKLRRAIQANLNAMPSPRFIPKSKPGR